MGLQVRRTGSWDFVYCVAWDMDLGVRICLSLGL
jgi:hypothetical protein